ncbi:hypothetical protein CC86DRAFT_255477, partial [Ophiobolus disseminans]
PSTVAEKDIETARRRTRESYHAVNADRRFATWYLEAVQVPYVAERLQSLYKDREQVTRQRNIIVQARANLSDPGTTECDEMQVDDWHSLLYETYRRVLTLYDERLVYIQEVAVTRVTLWSEWNHQNQKHGHTRKNRLIAACESTIVYMEDDYINRMLDFVTEVYALLEKHDMVHAKMVMDDVISLMPSLTTT